MEKSFCIEALEEALSKGAKPEIFNTDQGTQYTSREFTGVLKRNEIKISMDGRGRALDNVFIERFWRTVKYEEIYLNHYESVWDLEDRLTKWFDFYCRRRRHSALEPARKIFEKNIHQNRNPYCNRREVYDNRESGSRGLKKRSDASVIFELSD